MMMGVFGDLQLGAFKTSPAPRMYSDANHNFVLAYMSNSPVLTCSHSLMVTICYLSGF